MFHLTRRVFSKTIEGAILIFLIIVACYVSMGRILVANIEKFRTDIEVALTGALNVDVRVDGLRGDWTYLDPEIQIDRLTIGDPGLPAIDIEHLSARIDTVASIREGTIVVREIDVVGLALAVAQDKDGAWAVEGLPRTNRGFNATPLLASLKYLHVVGVSGVDVEIKARKQHYHLTNQEDKPFLLVSDGGQKLLEMPLLFQEPGKKPSEFYLLGRYSGDPRVPADFAANLYLHLPPIELSDFFPASATSRFLPRELAVAGEFWLDFRLGAFEITALPTIDVVGFRSEERNVSALKNVSARLKIGGNSLNDFQVYVDNLSSQVGSVQWSLSGINVAMFDAGDKREFAVHIPELSVVDSTRAVLELGTALGVLSEAGGDIIRAFDPGGRLTDVMLSTSTRDAATEEPFKLTATLRNAHIEPWRGSPGISALNGFLSVSPGSGYIDVHNDAFTLDFANMFSEPWPFDSANARIYFSVSEGLVEIKSDVIEVANGDLRASGRFHLNLPSEKLDRTWGLEVGIENGDLVDANRYLPGVLSGELIDWLDRAVIGGHTSSAGLLFHGPLDPGAPKVGKVYELFFKIDDAILDYDPAWPEVRDLFATIYIGNWGVHSGNASGKVFDTRIARGEVSVPIPFGDVPDSILIRGEFEGPVSDGIRILSETPIDEMTGGVTRDWEGEGRLTGLLNLNVPIGPRQDDPFGVDVDIYLSDDSIYMGGYNLSLLKLGGKISYSNKSGLTSEKFTALLFDRPAAGRITTDQDDDGGAIGVYVDGTVDVSDLREWSDQVILERASGVATYKAHVYVPFGNRAELPSYVEATSDLDGVAINLPAPMKKSADDIMSLSYKQLFLESGFRLDLTLGDLFRSSLSTVDGALSGGRFHFGREPMGTVAYDQIRVTGAFDRVDYDEWDELMKSLERVSDLSIQSTMADNLESIDVDVKTLNAFGLELDKVETYITRDVGVWNVRLANQMLAGLIKIADSESMPIDISLDYLKFPASETGEDVKAPDPLADIDPNELIAIDFRVEEFDVGDEDYGKWSFQLRPHESGVVLENLAAEVKGISVAVPSKVTWRYDTAEGHVSRFEGGVRVLDLANALKQWGFASSIEGSEFVFDADIDWPGSPAMVDMGTIKGLVHLRQGKGRFVQAESGTGALRLLGIFDFNSLARRFQFDFSDVVDKGFSFTEIKGTTRFDSGVASIVEPIVIVGAGSTFKVGGSFNLNDNTLDNDMIVTLPVSRNLPWYAAYSAIATGPLVGASVWLAQKIFENQINAMSSAKYKITGTVDNPTIEFVSLFSDSVRKSSAEAPAPKSEPAVPAVEAEVAPEEETQGIAPAKAST